MGVMVAMTLEAAEMDSEMGSEVAITTLCSLGVNHKMWVGL